MNKLTIFRELNNDPIIKSVAAKDYHQTGYLLSRELIDKPLTAPVLASYVLDRILTSTNILAVEASRRQVVNPALIEAAAEELETIRLHIGSYPEPKWLGELNQGDRIAEQHYRLIADEFADWMLISAREVIKKLIAFHQARGYGKLVRHQVWRWQGQLIGVVNPDPITLDHLIGYEYQKAELIKNTETFLFHDRGNNVLLTGERGTGKSSLIKAVANCYADRGLSLIEVPRNYLTDLPLILETLKHQPQHYIIFIDDLSFDGADKEYKELKAILEGGVEALSNHIRLYATSNRKHLVLESWKDRSETAYDENNEVRMGDSMNEKLSLADRFGLALNFLSPSQEEYLAIVLGIAKAEQIDLPTEELKAAAIKWARWQNNPSGRTARQFINSLVK